MNRPLSLLILLVLSTASHATKPFHIYAPSRTTNEVLVFEATPSPAGDKLTLAAKEPIRLDFSPSTIVAHPKKPILYVSTNKAKDGQSIGTAITLDKAGGCQNHRDIPLARGHGYLSLDPANKFLLGVNYSSGRVDVYPLADDGTPGAPVTSLNEGLVSAHCVLPSPDNRFVYIPYVKDSNAIYQYQFDPESGALTPLDPKNAKPPEGTGPRHLAYHPSKPYVYFSNEQGLGVSVYEKHLSSGQLALHQVCEILPANERPKAGASASDIAITADGKFLFTGLRSSADSIPNAIARYRILESGAVEHLGLTPADTIPWGLTLSPSGQYLFATAFKGGTLTAYKISDDGDLTKAASLPIPLKISDLITR